MLSLSVEMPRIEFPQPGSSEADEAALPISLMTVAETTLPLKSDQGQTIQASVSRDRNGGRDVLITVVASTAEQQPGTATGRTPERDQGTDATFRRSPGIRSAGAAGRVRRMKPRRPW